MMTKDELAAIKARHERDQALRHDWPTPPHPAHADRAALLAEVERLKKDTHQSPALPFGTAAGCMCPSGANLYCQNSFCPRRNPPGITWRAHT